MKKQLLTMILIFSSPMAIAISQNDISIEKYPEAFKASSCVKSSYYIDDSTFANTKYKKSSQWRFHMHERLGVGFYAPNGEKVVSNYESYVSKMGKKEASLHLWKIYNCKNHL